MAERIAIRNAQTKSKYIHIRQQRAYNGKKPEFRRRLDVGEFPERNGGKGMGDSGRHRLVGADERQGSQLAGQVKLFIPTPSASRYPVQPIVRISIQRFHVLR